LAKQFQHRSLRTFKSKAYIDQNNKREFRRLAGASLSCCINYDLESYNKAFGAEFNAQIGVGGAGESRSKQIWHQPIQALCYFCSPNGFVNPGKIILLKGHLLRSTRTIQRSFSASKMEGDSYLRLSALPEISRFSLGKRATKTRSDWGAGCVNVLFVSTHTVRSRGRGGKLGRHLSVFNWQSKFSFPERVNALLRWFITVRALLRIFRCSASIFYNVTTIYARIETASSKPVFHTFKLGGVMKTAKAATMAWRPGHNNGASHNRNGEFHRAFARYIKI